MIDLLNIDNMNFDTTQRFDVIFADYVYENLNFDWIEKYWSFLKDGGIFIAMTDFHSLFECGMQMKSLQNSFFINHIPWKNEWGNFPKDRFHQVHDDILIFSKGKHKCFHFDRIQVDKVTKNKGLNPSGRDTKTATAFISDITLTTTSKERIKQDDGHLVRWQKPESLMQRILEPFTDVGDWILEPFGGTFSACRWAKKNGRNAVGIELDTKVYELGKKAVEDINDVPVQMQKMLF